MANKGWSHISLATLDLNKTREFYENVLGFKFLSKDVYYISDLPSEVQLRDVATIGLVSLALAFYATLYPSWRAARLNPAEALRYE